MRYITKSVLCTTEGTTHLDKGPLGLGSTEDSCYTSK